MTWFDSATNQAAAEAAHVEVVEFVKLGFPSGDLNVHTRLGTLDWGGESWLGVGHLGKIEPVKEDTEIRPTGLRLTLSGVDAALVTTAISDEYHGSSVSVYVGWLNVDTLALVDTPETVFRGLIDYLAVELGPSSGTIVVNCESELARWSRPRQLLYTPESQNLLGYADDQFFDNTKFMPDRQIEWVKKYSPGYVLQQIVRAGMRGRGP